MVEITKYEPGTPTWVDLGSPDLEGSKAFYGALFGWEADAIPDPDAGGYTMFTLRGKNVAGLGPLMNEGQPPSWTTYVSVTDADQTLKLAEENGGKTILAPMDVFDAGRMAILADSIGAVVALWQPNKHIGSEIVNEPGAFSWSELLVRDVEGAKAFYSATFGWEPKTSELMPGLTYTEWKLGEKSIGGMMEMGDYFPVEVPPFWMAYFGTASVDDTIAKASQLGGRVLKAAMDIPGVGRFGTVSDPHGAVFSLFEFS